MLTVKRLHHRYSEVMIVKQTSLEPVRSRRFSVAQRDGRWWLIRPDARRMVILSANHSHQVLDAEPPHRWSEELGEELAGTGPLCAGGGLPVLGLQCGVGGTATYGIPYIIESEVTRISSGKGAGSGIWISSTSGAGPD